MSGLNLGEYITYHHLQISKTVFIGKCQVCFSRQEEIFIIIIRAGGY